MKDSHTLLIRAFVVIFSLFSVFTIPVLSAETTSLETIQVTANRMAQAIDETLYSVSVLTREDIEASTATTLEDLLSRLPGVTVAKTGGAGQPASVFIRGTETDHLLVMIDGVRIASVTTGAAALHLIPLQQIERLELVRGPRSGAYGSEAVGGVLQIFTSASRNGAYASIEAGSNSTQNLRGGYSWSGERFGGDLTLARSATDGIDVFKNVNPDKDEYEDTSVSANLRFSVSEKLVLQGHLLKADGDTDFDSTFQETLSNKNESEQQTAGITASYYLSDNLTFSAEYGQSRDKIESENINTDNSGSSSFFNSKSDQYGIKMELSPAGNNRYHLGYDFRDDKIDGSSTAYKETSRDNEAIYAGWDFYAASNQHFHADFRVDDNESFGKHETGSLGYGLKFTNGVLLSVTVARGLKTPSFNDLYFPDFPPFFFSNPNLEPETSQSIEMGLSKKLDNGHWKINLYQNKIEDLIATSGDTVDNIDEAKIRGLELEYGVILPGEVALAASYSRINSENKQTRETLIRRPENTATLSLGKTWNQFSASLEARYVDDSEDLDFATFPASRATLDSYSLVDLKLGYNVSERLVLFANFTNIMDEKYETILNYNQHGFETLIGIRFKQ